MEKQRMVRRQDELVGERHRLDDGLRLLVRITELPICLVGRRELETSAGKKSADVRLRDQRNERRRIEAAASSRKEWINN